MRYLAVLILLGLSGCYQTIQSADGLTFYSYECETFEECMEGVRQKCPASYEVVSAPVIPLIPGKTPRQVFAAGSAGDQVVFRCKDNELPELMQYVRSQINAVRRNMQ